MVKDMDGREIVITWHANSAYFVLLKFSKEIQVNAKYIQLRDKYATSYTSNVSVHFLIFFRITNAAYINVKTYSKGFIGIDSRIHNHHY